LKAFTGVFRNDEMQLKIQIELKESKLTIFGDHHLKPKIIDKFYLDNICIVVNYVKDGRGLINQIIIEEKDLVGNRMDEGTRFNKIR